MDHPPKIIRIQGVKRAVPRSMYERSTEKNMEQWDMKRGTVKHKQRSAVN